LVLAVVGLATIAGLGWWLYVQQKVDGYIAAKAGIPSDAIIAFRDGCPPDKTWEQFGDDHFLIGLGKTRNAGLTGGREDYPLTERNIPKDQHETQLKRPMRDDQFIWGLGEPHNNLLNGGPVEGGLFADVKTSPYGEANPAPVPTMPPWIAVAFCKKK
jgi:hypothetical protein